MTKSALLEYPFPMIDLHELTQSDLKKELEARGEKGFRASQILHSVYKKGIQTIDEIHGLSKEMKVRLKNDLQLTTLLLKNTLISFDSETTKFLWQLPDKQLVESVLISAPDRKTVCVSSQVGCPARCAFCASGKQGLKRNLSSSEIVQQVFLIDNWLKKQGEKVSHVVFMGMGEPFENYENVLKAIQFLIDPSRFGLSQRRITVSTVGIVEGINRFSKEGLHINLVLSLHAPNQRIRQKIIPYARKYPLEDILAAMLNFSQKSGRDITYEYTLMEGINDRIEDAEELAKLIEGHPCTVNLIPYNPVSGLKLKRPSKEAIFAFRDYLVAQNIPTTWRYTKGKDISAACGQLALQTQTAMIE